MKTKEKTAKEIGEIFAHAEFVEREYKATISLGKTEDGYYVMVHDVETGKCTSVGRVFPHNYEAMEAAIDFIEAGFKNI